VQILKFQQHEIETWRLTEEGQMIAEHGSHEVQVFEAIAKSMRGLSLDELGVNLYF
jgi:hypothetical protein